MDLSHPLRTVVPSLDAFVLEVLAGTTRPLSAREVARLVNQGSVSGVRLVLGRLTTQGLAQRDTRSSATFYTANRDHVAWPAVRHLLDLYRELEDRIRERVSAWEIPPVTLALFGSAARRDGSAESDIDILLIEPADHGMPDRWNDQRHDIAEAVERWTGNSVQIYDLDEQLLAAHFELEEQIVSQWRKDARTLVGRNVTDLLPRRGR